MENILITLLLTVPVLAFAGTSGTRAGIDKDRFMEVDLFWFDKDDMKGSSDKFWDRMSPLFENVDGEKGVVFNVGWLMDIILMWDGNLDSSIPFPPDMKIQPQFEDEGMFIGTTPQKKDLWKQRFCGWGWIRMWLCMDTAIPSENIWPEQTRSCFLHGGKGWAWRR